MSTSTSIEERVRGVVTGILDVNDSDLNSSVRFRDLGATSIDFVEILSGVENEFNVDIPDDVMAELNTVDKLVAYVEPRVSA